MFHVLIEIKPRRSGYTVTAMTKIYLVKIHFQYFLLGKFLFHLKGKHGLKYLPRNCTLARGKKSFGQLLCYRGTALDNSEPSVFN